MEQRIDDMVKILTAGGWYDREVVHGDYDDLLKDFILDFDPALLPKMMYLLSLETDFWYA